MASPIVTLCEEHLPIVGRFSARTWKRPSDEAFLRWRYLEAPGQKTFLVLRDGECVAMLSAISRPFRVAGQSVRIWETFDWYTLPELRLSGLGIKLLRNLMKHPDPILAAGGSADTRALLPRLGWRDLAESHRWVLPLRGQHYAEVLEARVRLPRAITTLPLDLLTRGWFRPRSRAAPPQGRVIPVASVGPEVQSLYDGETGYGTHPVADPAQLRWMSSGYPGTGLFCALYFAIGDELRGWALVRVFNAGQQRVASLVDIFAPRPTTELYTWMVSEAAAGVSGHGAVRFGARSTCPILNAALRANRFLERDRSPVRYWSGSGVELSTPLHVTMNHQDEAFRPYPERWW